MLKEESFYIKGYDKQLDVLIEIIPNEGHFAVKQLDRIIGIIQNNEEWEQVSGDPIKNDTLDLIYEEIKNRYE